MRKKQLYEYVAAYFRKEMPAAETELHYEDPFQLLVAVILSAQCTDKRVNMVTPDLFKAYPDAESMAQADAEEICPYIKSISYPNNKAKHLAGMARMLVDDHNGKVPGTHAELEKLPGVGRKTANVVASVAFQVPGMPVDTHVFRVSQRIGLVKPSKTPLAVEKQLLANIPEEQLHIFHHWLILHGRYVCTARSPKCEACGLRPVCKYYIKSQKKGTVADPK